MRYFVAVAEERNFTRAAARLHLAQPSLSRQIRDLEQELGVSLLHRAKGGITLTAAGNEYLAQARKLLADSRPSSMREGLNWLSGRRSVCEGRLGTS